MHVGKAELTALVFESKALVIQPEDAQNGGIEIMHMDRVLHGGKAQIIGTAIGQTAFDPTPASHMV